MHAVEVAGAGVEQGSLADARLSPQCESSSAAVAGSRDERGQRTKLLITPDEGNEGFDDDNETLSESAP
jgi:hypothetical protein